MSCEACNESPCSCGWEYQGWSDESLAMFLAAITNYRDYKERRRILKMALEILEDEWDS